MPSGEPGSRRAELEREILRQAYRLGEEQKVDRPLAPRWAKKTKSITLKRGLSGLAVILVKARHALGVRVARPAAVRHALDPVLPPAQVVDLEPLGARPRLDRQDAAAVGVRLGLGLDTQTRRLGEQQLADDQRQGRGLARREFEQFGIPMDESRERYDEAAPLIIEATFGVAAVVIAEAGLSFLGLGVQPPAASWGAMIRDGTRYLLVAPHMVLAPWLAIFVVVVSVNLLGDRLRDRLDTRSLSGRGHAS